MLRLWISIPQWFDWDVLGSSIISISSGSFPFHNGSIETEYFTTADFHYCKFPFHNGSIETKREGIGKSIVSFSDFHSTMVRLRRKVSPPTRRDSEVISIPQWFDWDSGRAPGKISNFAFPFHNGSIETALLRREWRRFALISIPQWFDWDWPVSLSQGFPPLRFPFHNGSIETLFRLSQSLLQGFFDFHSTMVRLRRSYIVSLPLS